MRFLALLSLCLFLTACDNGPSIAVVDVNKILVSSPHAKKADAEIIQTQEIYQYNLNVIEKKLATYKNRPQADAWRLEAGRQLQAQMVNSHKAISQTMAVTLRKEILDISLKYDVVLAKGNILANKESLDITAGVQQRYDTATITWPLLPKRIDNPNLPADPEIVQPEIAQPETVKQNKSKSKNK